MRWWWGGSEVTVESHRERKNGGGGEGAVSERNVLAPYKVNELMTLQTVQQVCNTCVKHCYY